MVGKKHITVTVIEETLPEDQVQFKPLFGIRPGVYLAGLYAVILGIILFFVLLYPGIINPGSVLAVRSEPSGAAVRADDVYIGTTPCEVFIPKGTREIALILPGFAPDRQELEVRSRLLGSLFFPRRQAFTGTLEETDTGAALLWAASDYGVWSFTGEPTATYQIPQTLSEGAYRSGPGASDPSGHQRLEDILKGAARFTSTRAGLRDLIRAKYFIDNAGLSPSPVSLLRSIEDILVYLSEVPGAAQRLKELLPPETAELLADSAWYAGQNTGALPDSVPPVFGESISLGLLAFREISGGTLLQGGALPHKVPVQAFSIAETKVSYASWEAFIKTNPLWSPEQRETLIAQGLVTEDYLGPSQNLDSSGVSGVSWYAAEAYCEWLTGLLPPGLADYEVRLPTEAEWEYAAKAALITENSASGIKDMLGGFWEWCADPYVHNNSFPADRNIIQAVGSPERAVRGNALIPVSAAADNRTKQELLETRGSLFPASCSQFGSFRPVIVRKGSFYE